MPTKSAVMARLLALALLPTPMLAGCARTTVSSESSQALCDQFRPINWADADTDDTIRGVKEHNAVFVKLCRWKP